MNLKEKVREREKKAVDLGLLRKAPIIAETFGKSFPDYSGDRIRKGHVYKSGDLFIKISPAGTYGENIAIYHRKEKPWPGLLRFVGSWQVYRVVFSQIDSHIEIFRNEDDWMAEVERIYRNADVIKKAKSRKKEIDEEEKEDKGLKDKFGL